jgi:hypothetical protein
MTFGKRMVPPAVPQPEDDNCPDCRGVGAIRGRGQRKLCLLCKGTGKKPQASSIEPPAADAEAATISLPADACAPSAPAEPCEAAAAAVDT